MTLDLAVPEGAAWWTRAATLAMDGARGRLEVLMPGVQVLGCAAIADPSATSPAFAESPRVGQSILECPKHHRLRDTDCVWCRVLMHIPTPERR